MKKLLLIILGIALIVSASMQFFSQNKEPVQETITFFPIDPNAYYLSAYTTLIETPKYDVEWNTSSVLDRKAYLRQDVSLLFSNGRLINKMGEWRTDTSKLFQKKTVPIKQNGILDSVTFHYSELHPKGGRIFSAQTMTSDILYFFESSKQLPHFFSKPKTREEQKWKTQLEVNEKNVLNHAFAKGVRRFSIPSDRYDSYPLTKFVFGRNETIPGFSQAGTSRILGNLWEGIYKNYFLGIKKRNGATTDPVGSTIPIIMIAKDHSHLLVLFEAADGEPIYLRQLIEGDR